MVSFPSAVAIPSTASYAPPLMSFDWIANLANDYYKGKQNQFDQQQRERTTALEQPINSTDPSAVAQTLLQRGGSQYAAALMPFLQQQQQIKAAQQPDPFLQPQVPQAAPQTDGNPPPASAGLSRPTGAGGGGQSAINPTGETVAAIVSSVVPGEKAGTVAANVARAIGVDPATPLNSEQQARVTNLVRGYAQRTGAASPQGGDQGLARLQGAIFGQESGSGRNTATSVTGARGGMQIEPATFLQYASAGENIDNPTDNRNVGNRILADYYKRYNGDAARAAVAYFSGPGNVAPPGSPTPWKRDVADPTGKKTSSYVDDVMHRMGTQALGQATAQAPAARVAQGFGAAPGGAAPAAAAAPTAAPQRGPIGPQVPLPKGYTDPQQAILALRERAAQLSVNPAAAGQARFMETWADKIEQSLQPFEVRPGETLLSRRTGDVIYQGAPTNPNALALQRFLAEHPNATAQQIDQFLQAGRSSGRSAIAMYMNKFLAEHPDANADEVKRAAQLFTTQTTAQNRFLSGPQGNTIRSLNVVVSHLQTMQDLGNALKNGNVRLFNSIAQRFAEETGDAAPTNFDTAKQIVGAEVIKALGVAGAGSQSERQEAADAFNRARSPEQLAGAIAAARKLLVGQLEGLRRQYVVATGLPGDTFDQMLEPETKSFFSQDRTHTPESGRQGDDGWGEVKVH